MYLFSLKTKCFFFLGKKTYFNRFVPESNLLEYLLNLNGDLKLYEIDIYLLLTVL